MIWLETAVGDGVATVSFANRAISKGLDAPVYDTDGVTRLAGTNYVAQLFAGATSVSLMAIGAPAPFRTGNAAGYWDTYQNSTRVLPVTGGEVAYVQARVWDRAFGATYEDAVAAGSKHGESTVFEITTIASSEKSPPPLVDFLGLESFSLIGETLTITINPGISLISNPISKGKNSVAEVLPNLPDGTTLFRWDNSTQTYSMNSYDFGSWANPNQEFPPGSGAIICNPTDHAIQITFSGALKTGERITARVPGYFLIGATDTQTSNIEAQLDFPPVDGDTVYRFVNGNYQLSVYEFNNWQGFQPVIAPGESVFVRLVAP